MSLSLHLSESPDTGGTRGSQKSQKSSSQPKPSSQHKPLSQPKSPAAVVVAASPAPTPAASSSQIRLSASTRSRRKVTSDDTKESSAAQPSATVNIPATPSVEPSAAPATQANNSKNPALASNGRSSRSRASAAATVASASTTAASSAAASSASSRSRPKPAPLIDDNSLSYLSSFTFPPIEGPPHEPGGTFLVFTHYSPMDDSLQCILFQQSSLYRIYTFSGQLSTLKPYGLYMSGMKDEDYKNYVLNGLCEQDSKERYEYEFVTVSGEDELYNEDSEDMTRPSGVEAKNQIRAQLKLYKQMGEATRVPVCIAHIRFEPLKLTPSSSRSLVLARQDETQYKQSVCQLVSALTQWTHRLRARRATHDATITRQAEESKIADELDTLPVTLPHVARTLLDSMANILNEKKGFIRQGREHNAKLEAEIALLRPKKRLSAKHEQMVKDEISESSEDEEMDEQFIDVEREDDIKPTPEQIMREEQESPLVQQRQAPAQRRHDPDGVRPMEIDDDDDNDAVDVGVPVRKATHGSATLPGLLPHQRGSQVLLGTSSNSRSASSLPFPDSIEPVSLGGDFSPSLAMSSVSMSRDDTPHRGASRRTKTSASQSSLPPQHHGSPAAAAAGASSEIDLSPPRVRAMVRKRARPVVVQSSPSQLSPSYTSPSQQPSHTHRQVNSLTSPPQGVAAAIAAAAPHTNAGGGKSKDASQVIRELASVHASMRRGGAGGAKDPSPEQHSNQSADPQPSAGKKRRTQGSRNSGLLAEME